MVLELVIEEVGLLEVVSSVKKETRWGRSFCQQNKKLLTMSPCLPTGRL